MPTCRYCGAEHTADELIRHERGRLIIVHCPDCEVPMGTYRRHGDDPQTDTLRG